MTTLENIEKGISNYLDAKETEYAVMINGAWGSGKTHFCKSKISQLIVSKKFKPIYVSLYGLETAKNIDDLILKNVFSLESKQTEKVGNIFQNLFKSLTLKFNNDGPQFTGNISALASGLGGIVKQILLERNLNNSVLCFDDLERTIISSEEALAYINNFVEHKEIKTILICNENEIGKEEQELYGKIKEKTVGYTFDLQPNLRETINFLVPRYNNSFFEDIIRKNINLILEILEAGECQNIRIIKRSLDIANVIFTSLESFEGQTITTVEREIIWLIFSLHIEQKTGKNKKYLEKIKIYVIDGYSKYYAYKLNQQECNIRREDTSKLDEEFLEATRFLEKFYYDKKYASYLDLSKLVFISIFEYVVSGYFQEDLLKKEIEELEISERKIFLHPFNYYLLSDEEFDSISKQYIKELKEDLIDEATELIKTFRTLAIFASQNVLSENSQDIFKIFKQTLERQIEKNKLRYKTLSYKNLYFDSCYQFIEDKQEFEQIKNIIEHDINRKIEEDQRKSASDLIVKLKENPEDFFEEAFEQNKNQWNLFNYFDIDELFKSIIKLDNIHIKKFNIWLSNRYKHSYVSVLEAEQNNLKELKEKLKSYIDRGTENNCKKLHHLLLEKINENIEIICEGV